MKIQDPTEAALSAIQEALTLELDGAKSETSEAAQNAEGELQDSPALPELEDPSLLTERPTLQDMPDAGDAIAPAVAPIRRRTPSPEGEDRRREPAPRTRPEGTERRAANDDRQTFGQLVSQLRRRPSMAPYWWAIFGGLLWVGVGIAMAFAYHRGLVESSNGVQSLLDSPALLGVFASILLPPLAFLGMAAMVRRSQQLEVIARSMTDVALRLAQPETIATESVVTVGQAVRREVSAMADGVDRATARATELEAMVRAEVSILERAYEDNEIRIRSLVDELQAERHAIQLETERLRDGIAGTEAILSEEVKLISGRIHDTMMEASEQVTEILSQKGENITSALAQVGDSMIDSLTAKGAELIDRLQITGSEIRDDLSSSGDLLVETLKSRTDDLATNLLTTTTDVTAMIDRWGVDVNVNIDLLKAQIGETLAQNTTELHHEIAARISESGDNLRAASETIVAGFASRGDELVQRVEEGSQKAVETLGTRGVVLAEQIQIASDRIYDAVVVRGESLPERLAETGERISTSLDRSGTQVTSALVEKGDAITAALTQAGEEMTERLSTVGSDITKSIGARGSKVTDSFRETADMLGVSIGNKGEAIREMLTARLTAIEETITIQGSELADRLHQESASLARTVQDGVKAFDTTVRVHAPELVDQINLRVNTVNDNLRLSVESLDERLNSTTSAVASTMDQRLARIEQTMDQRTQSFSETFAARTLDFARSIAEGTRGTNDALDKSVETLNTLFATSSKTMGETMAEHVEKASRTLDNRVQDVASMLDGRVAHIEQQVFGRLETMADTFENRSAVMADTLANRVDTVSGHLKTEAAEVERALTSLSENVTTSLSSHAAKVSESLGDRLNEIAHLIDDKNGAFLVALERTSQRAVNEITATNSSLKGDVQAIIERLGEANSTFQEAMASAVGNLGDFSGNFARQVEGFNKTVHEIGHSVEDSAQRFDAQIETLKSLSSGALTDVGGLTERLEQQGRLLGDATQALGATHDRVESTLTARRAAMEEISGTLVQRVEDLESRLQQFHAMMDASFKGTQDRVRQIAGAVSEASTGSARVIEGQFELVRDAANAERERTAAALRQTYEAALQDMQKLFGDTGSRFADAARELKQTAQDVQHSIELAREEMKRGILELPSETEASAATMRRAVAEQIKALAELNEIVARQGQALDVVEAGARSATRSLARENSLHLIGETRAKARPAPVEKAADVNESLLSELLGDLAPAEAATTATPVVKAAPKAETPESSLASLSAEIGQLVDARALSEAWDRYLRGDRKAFIGRIYTPQGRKTYDALRRRYREEQSFRTAVEHALSTFDEVLDKVSANDKGFVATKAQLNSDKGHVYTMLAQAAGRFQ
ncbi:hypothetical protein ACT6QH_01185 [Xanthobacter sp. TB0139]|uniref:apolipoprotein A-IV repeat region-like domain-containing protein n=1 Tax=Xanthobacter sp. TB0139 TaxID=3459178 RepID=UPI004039C1B2